MPSNRQFNLRTGQMSSSEAYAAGVDAGLRTYMLKVYNYMALGLALTGAVAFVASTSSNLMQMIFGTPLQWVVMLAPLGLVFFLTSRIQRMSPQAAQISFWFYAAVMGLSLSYIFLAFTGTSITRVFFIAGGMFAGMSLYGYTTKRDLSGFGGFLVMGLIGLIIASVVNLFMQSEAIDFAISVVGVLIFTGLTAYDTQRIKSVYSATDDSAVAEKKAIMGALTLYLDFINLFIMLLQLFGNRE